MSATVFTSNVTRFSSNNMSDRDQDIIYHKTGLTSEIKALSTQELADKYHLTTQHVNRIYKKGLAILQEVVRA